MNLSLVRLVVCDMDGTLLDSAHEASARFFELFAQFGAHGIEFAAASGRQYGSIVDKLAPIRDDITVIAENGAIMRRGSETLLETALRREEVADVLERVSKLVDVHPVVCTADCAYAHGHDRDFVSFMSEFYADYKLLEDLETYEGTPLKIALYTPGSSEELIYPHLKDLAPRLKVKVSGPHWVDISNPEAHKGKALRQLQTELGVSPAETMAFGDYHNDLEMLALADFSFAMGNAHPDIVAAARYQTASNDEGGVEQVLTKVVAARTEENSAS